MNSIARYNIIKHAVYVLLMLLLYVLQSVPGLFVIQGVKPILLIPAAISISMFEGEFAGGVYGAFAGLLCDVSSFLLFGFNGFITTFFCVVSGLLVIHLMRCNLLSCVLFSFVTLLFRGSVEYFFSYGMWSYENARSVYIGNVIPTVLYSSALSVIAFFLFRGLHTRFSLFEESSL